MSVFGRCRCWVAVKSFPRRRRGAWPPSETSQPFCAPKPFGCNVRSESRPSPSLARDSKPPTNRGATRPCLCSLPRRLAHGLRVLALRRALLRGHTTLRRNHNTKPLRPSRMHRTRNQTIRLPPQPNRRARLLLGRNLHARNQILLKAPSGNLVRRPQKRGIQKAKVGQSQGPPHLLPFPILQRCLEHALGQDRAV